MSDRKHQQAKVGHVLIDDRKDAGTLWNLYGGTFIHHTSTENTLKQLRELEILPAEIPIAKGLRAVNLLETRLEGRNHNNTVVKDLLKGFF